MINNYIIGSKRIIKEWRKSNNVEDLADVLEYLIDTMDRAYKEYPNYDKGVTMMMEDDRIKKNVENAAVRESMYVTFLEVIGEKYGSEM